METLTRSRPSAGRTQPAQRRWSLPALAASGSLLGYAILLSILAGAVESGRMGGDAALPWLACAGIAAGAVYLASLFALARRAIAVPWLWIIGVAVAARLIVATSPPMPESDSQDYQRYLWDGAVSASGLNPYRHAPSDVAAGDLTGPDTEKVLLLARNARSVLSRINHPHLATIYPPLAQGGFALAYLVDPFGVTGWRAVLGIADAVTFLLLARLLKVLGLPALQILWYAWNPLLLREVYSSLHMDMLVLPLIAGALLAGVTSRNVLAAALCVAGSAVKVWPVLLVPLLLSPLRSRRRVLAAAMAVCAALLALLWAPVLAVPHGESSGFVAYAGSWQSNDGFFRAGIWLTERVLSVIRVEPWHSHRIMRVISAALVVGIVLWQSRLKPQDPRDLPRRCLFVVCAIFLLSPTQFPWYWLWCLPLLAVRPSLPMLLYTALLPLYFLADRTQAVYWIEHAPVWGLLAFELLRTTRSPQVIQGQEVVHA